MCLRKVPIFRAFQGPFRGINFKNGPWTSKGKFYSYCDIRFNVLRNSSHQGMAKSVVHVLVRRVNYKSLIYLGLSSGCTFFIFQKIGHYCLIRGVLTLSIALKIRENFILLRFLNIGSVYGKNYVF